MLFSIRTTKGFLSILFFDTFLAYLSFGTIFFLLPGHMPWLNKDTTLNGNIIFFIFTMILLISLAINRLYQPVNCIYLADLIKKIIPAFFSAFFFFSTLFFFFPNLIDKNWHILPVLILFFSAIILFRLHVFFNMKENREKILLLGISEQGREIIKESVEKRMRGYDIIGFATAMDSQMESTVHNVPVLGHIKELESIISTHTIDTVVVTLRSRRGKLPVDQLLNCKFKNIRILEGAQFYEIAKQKILIDDFFKPSSFIFEEGFYYTSLHEFMKRAQGLSVSIILLILLSPVLFITAILIKLESPGQIFYLQERVGLHGRIFKLLKFRSMTETAEKESGPKFAIKGDMRVTRIGKIIRKIRLDEVPQLINIFMGDMDLVGPRPEREVFVNELEKIVPYYALRHSVRPGLTGWAQVNYPYGENFEDSEEKLKYDLYYIKHYSWYLDMQIFFMTVREIIFAKGH